jgi:hypothetical protein
MNEDCPSDVSLREVMIDAVVDARGVDAMLTEDIVPQLDKLSRKLDKQWHDAIEQSDVGLDIMNTDGPIEEITLPRPHRLRKAIAGALLAAICVHIAAPEAAYAAPYVAEGANAVAGKLQTGLQRIAHTS